MILKLYGKERRKIGRQKGRWTIDGVTTPPCPLDQLITDIIKGTTMGLNYLFV